MTNSPVEPLRLKQLTNESCQSFICLIYELFIFLFIPKQKVYFTLEPSLNFCSYLL